LYCALTCNYALIISYQNIQKVSCNQLDQKNQHDIRVLQVNFPLCTLAHTPRLPEHCIEYVRLLLWSKDNPFGGDEVAIDGDDPAHITWIFEKSLERATHYGIQGVTYRLVLSIYLGYFPPGRRLIQGEQTLLNCYCHFVTIVMLLGHLGLNAFTKILNASSIPKKSYRHFFVFRVIHIWKKTLLLIINEEMKAELPNPVSPCGLRKGLGFANTLLWLGLTNIIILKSQYNPAYAC
jgi:hypothetical protein